MEGKDGLGILHSERKVTMAKHLARGHLLKSKRHKGTDDNSGVQNVPQVAAVGARVKQDAQVDDLKRDVFNRVGGGEVRAKRFFILSGINI